jgi:hypothetical protein
MSCHVSIPGLSATLYLPCCCPSQCACLACVVCFLTAFFPESVLILWCSLASCLCGWFCIGPVSFPYGLLSVVPMPVLRLRLSLLGADCSLWDLQVGFNSVCVKGGDCVWWFFLATVVQGGFEAGTVLPLIPLWGIGGVAVHCQQAERQSSS